MKVHVELEVDIDLKEMSIAEVRKIIQQVVSADQSRMVKDVQVTNVKLL